MEKVEELLVSKGIYDSVDITVDDLAELEKYLSKNKYTDNTIDCFCVVGLFVLSDRQFVSRLDKIHDRSKKRKKQEQNVLHKLKLGIA